MNSQASYTLADWIENLRRRSPEWIRKFIPRKFKNLLIDFQWSLYRSRNKSLNEEAGYPEYPILIMSIPKCGTHLVKSLILSLPGTRLRKHFPSGIEAIDNFDQELSSYKKTLNQAKSGEIYSWHIPYENSLAEWLNKKKLKRIFIYRDPRDYTVSLSHFIMNNPSHPPPYPFRNLFAKMKSDDERLMACIRGISTNSGRADKMTPENLLNVREVYDESLEWLEDPNTFSIRYEDLISENSNDKKLRAIVDSLLIYLEVGLSSISDGAMNELISSARDGKKSSTFRSGRKENWRLEYKKEHVQAFKETAGDVLIKLGYEKDCEW